MEMNTELVSGLQMLLGLDVLVLTSKFGSL